MSDRFTTKKRISVENGKKEVGDVCSNPNRANVCPRGGIAQRKPTGRQAALRAGAEGTEALAEPVGRRPTPKAADAPKEV